MNYKPTILYVDDEEINLELFEINFEHKYNVICALSGSQGLKILNKKEDIALVISDLKMPEMNGLEFVKKAKQEFPHLVFFILTGFDITPEIHDAIRQKIVHKYLYKPFDLLAIEESIDNILMQDN